MVSNDIWNDKDLIKNEKSEQKFIRKMRKELLKSEERRRLNELKEVRSTNIYESERKKRFTTGKLLMYLIFINCSIVEIYSMWIMYQFQDLSPLYSLIGAVIGESISYGIYSAKSYKETNSEEQLKFEREKLQINGSLELTDEELKELDGVVPDDVVPDDGSGDIPEGVIMEETTYED